MVRVTEGKATIEAATPKVVSREMGVFYNPVMAFNRSFSILVLAASGKRQPRLALPLAGSGIRGVRFLKELPPSLVGEVVFNDRSADAAGAIGRHLEMNGIKERFRISNDDAVRFLAGNGLFSYIDIDPFGSPNPFLDAGIRALRRDGMLAVTATDTAPLSGTYPKACLRKYWATPLRTAMMHEVGLRILIRKVQLVGAQYEHALQPMASYARDHYFRVYFQNVPGKRQVDETLSAHHPYWHCPSCLSFGRGTREACPACAAAVSGLGPLYAGPLGDADLLKAILGREEGMGLLSAAEKRFVAAMAAEAAYERGAADPVGFYDLHELAKRHRIALKKNEKVSEGLRKKGIPHAFSHADPKGLKVALPAGELVGLIRGLA